MRLLAALWLPVLAGASSPLGSHPQRIEPLLLASRPPLAHEVTRGPSASRWARHRSDAAAAGAAALSRPVSLLGNPIQQRLCFTALALAALERLCLQGVDKEAIRWQIRTGVTLFSVVPMLRRVPLLRGAAIFVSAFAAACHLRCHMHAAAATRIQNRPSNATGAGGALTTGALFLSNIPRNVAEWIPQDVAEWIARQQPPRPSLFEGGLFPSLFEGGLFERFSLEPRRGKKNILILISDTGGGHRASAEALAGVLKQQHGASIDISIVDVLTVHGRWPYNNAVKNYRYMASKPTLWRLAYMATAFPPTRVFFNRMMSLRMFVGFKECFRKNRPDLIISMHPLCQAVPLQVLRRAEKAEAADRALDKAAGAAEGAAARERRRVPFVTVVTDLGSPHPLWLHPSVDLCFVPSEVFERRALYHGLRREQLRRYGLPVRAAFARQRRLGKVGKLQARRELGLLLARRTVLVVGGGDGVGKLEAIVLALAERLGKCAFDSQMVVVCGKNQNLKDKLRRAAWPKNVRVVVEGFVTRMPEYMAAVDCIVTKAGPGTIAEACICGLPVMLSGHLPGQETGNVRHVKKNGFGTYSKEPAAIAKTVSRWLASPKTLAKLSNRALRCAAPDATFRIAQDCVRLLDEGEDNT